MEWFRMYSDMPSDPKIGTLTDSQFRTWVELLCAAGRESAVGDTGLTLETVDWALRRNVTCDVTVLLQRALLSQDNVSKKLYVVKWEKRQMRSDSSVERVRKHREKKKRNVTETLPKQECNGLEREKEKKEKKEYRASKFVPPSLEEVSAYCLERGNGIDPQHFIDRNSSTGWMVGKCKMVDWKAAVRTWEKYQKDNKVVPIQKPEFDEDEWARHMVEKTKRFTDHG